MKQGSQYGARPQISCHSRERGNPGGHAAIRISASRRARNAILRRLVVSHWIPAFAGMTNRALPDDRVFNSLSVSKLNMMPVCFLLALATKQSRGRVLSPLRGLNRRLIARGAEIGGMFPSPRLLRGEGLPAALGYGLGVHAYGSRIAEQSLALKLSFDSRLIYNRPYFLNLFT